MNGLTLIRGTGEFQKWMDRAEELRKAAADAQTAYFEAVRVFEVHVGFEIDGEDLAEHTVESLALIYSPGSGKE